MFLFYMDALNCVNQAISGVIDAGSLYTKFIENAGQDFDVCTEALESILSDSLVSFVA